MRSFSALTVAVSSTTSSTVILGETALFAASGLNGCTGRADSVEEAAFEVAGSGSGSRASSSGSSVSSSSGGSGESDVLCARAASAARSAPPSPSRR